MTHAGDEQLHAVYTDLALEAHEGLMQQGGTTTVPGVHVETEQKEVAKVSRVAIDSDTAAHTMGKAKGMYVTLESTAIRDRDQEQQEALSQQLSKEINKFLYDLNIPEDSACLVIGLGNWNATPDALGPRTISELLVTRHLHELVPPEARGGLRPVATMAPGVLGITGIETSEIVRGVVDRIKPSLVLCVDALAARSSERLGTTIQLSDTGIQPGAGVGNKRRALDEETLGVPVLAIGVPTVIHALTIVDDALDWITTDLTGTPPPDTAFGGGQQGQVDTGPIKLDPSRISVHNVSDQATSSGNDTRGRTDPFGLPLDKAQKRYMMRSLLGPHFGDMIVTPKEIDILIDDVAETVAGAINTALHPSLDLDDVLRYLG